MVKYLIILFALLLSACENQDVARKRNEEKLPPGCKIVDLDYGDLRAAVVCDGRKSTTSLRSWDETIYITDSKGYSTPIINHYASISVTIE